MAIKTEKDLSENARKLWLKGVSAMEMKNYGYTITLLQSVLKEEPDFLDGRKLLRKAAIGNTKGKKSLFGGISPSLGGLKGGSLIKKDPLGALVAAEKILETDPMGAAGNRMLKEAALAADKPQIAAFALETMVEANPEDTKLLHELARHYYSFGLPKKALDTFNRILQINPNDMDAVKGSKDASAQASMSEGGWDQEEKSYRDLMKDKEAAEDMEQKSRVVRGRDMLLKELGEYGAKFEEDNNNLNVVKKIADIYEQLEDFENAATWYRYAGELSGGTDSNFARKASSMQVQFLDQRLTELKTWMDENEVHKESEEYAGVQKEYDEKKAERWSFALEEAKSQVERNPTDLQLRYELGDLYYQCEMYKEAMPELQKARQSPNARIKASNLLGQCMMRLGMLDLAANQFKEAANDLSGMDGTKKELLYNLGIVYEQMGKKEDYIECMKKIYEADMSFRDVENRVLSSYQAG